MFRHVNLKWALALAVPTIAALTVVAGAVASPQTVTFGSSNDGASAGWAAGKGSAIELTLGSSASSFADVKLHQVHGAAISSLTAPSFSTNDYNAGSPRYYITLSDGNSLWGYPSNAGLNGGSFAWAINNGNTYMSWDQVQASAEGAATVDQAYVIADADQAGGTVDEITGLTFGGMDYN